MNNVRKDGRVVERYPSMVHNHRLSIAAANGITPGSIRSGLPGTVNKRFSLSLVDNRAMQLQQQMYNNRPQQQSAVNGNQQQQQFYSESPMRSFQVAAQNTPNVRRALNGLNDMRHSISTYNEVIAAQNNRPAQQPNVCRAPNGLNDQSHSAISTYNEVMAAQNKRLAQQPNVCRAPNGLNDQSHSAISAYNEVMAAQNKRLAQQCRGSIAAPNHCTARSSRFNSVDLGHFPMQAFQYNSLKPPDQYNVQTTPQQQQESMGQFPVCSLRKSSVARR